MNPVRQEEIVERRKNIDSQTGERAKGLLIVGPNADMLAEAFGRILAATRIESAQRQDQALLAISANHFDAVLVDCRQDEHFQSLAIMSARQFTKGRIVMLVNDDFAQRVAIDLQNLFILSNRSSTADVLDALDYAPVNKATYETSSTAPETIEPVQPHSPADMIERTGEAANWLANLLPRLTPIYSLIYKNLALTILAALFTAFVAFGIMIAFFLISNKWSAPITLSKGNELVTKIERDMNDLNVRKNQINEQIDDARKNVTASEDELNRAKELADMIEGTISAEIETRSAMKFELEALNAALHKVLKQYGAGSVNPDFKGNLTRDFKARLINKNTFDAGKLAQLEAAHRTVLLKSEIAANEVEINRLASTLKALNALSGNVATNKPTSFANGGADLVPLLNQVNDVRKSVSVAAGENANAVKRDALLSNSLTVVETTMSEIEATPLSRAAKQNITVLFVPYENADQYVEGAPLYACAIGIFFCSNVGTVGKAIAGETVATHPFFNKPVRGSFVEAKLTNQEAAKKEIIHVKRRPLFF